MIDILKSQSNVSSAYLYLRKVNAISYSNHFGRKCSNKRIISPSIHWFIHMWCHFLNTFAIKISGHRQTNFFHIRIRNPPLYRVVQRGETWANSTEAGTKLERKSKYLPREARSGHSLTVETFPECNALPCRSTQSARVCCSLPVCINASKELKNVFLKNSLYI